MTFCYASPADTGCDQSDGQCQALTKGTWHNLLDNPLESRASNMLYIKYNGVSQFRFFGCFDIAALVVATARSSAQCLSALPFTASFLLVMQHEGARS